MDVRPQQRALAGLAVAEDEHVRLGVDVEPDRRELLLVDAQQDQLLRQLPPLRVLADRVERDQLGEQAQLGADRPLPGRRHRVDEVVHAVAEGVRGPVAVDAGQGAEEVELGGHQPAARTAGGHQCGDLAVDLGVERVTEPQLELGPEDVAHRGPEVGPAGRGAHDVEAEGQAARRELLDLHLEVVELRAQRAPAVDDEEHVPPPVVGAPLRASGAVGLDGVDAVVAEVGLAAVHDALDLGHHPADHVGLGTGRDPGDVGEPGERRERAAAEVEHEELRLQRGGDQRHARHDAAQERALARPRPADDGHVTGRAGEVERHGVAALLARAVDGAERDDQAGDVAPLLGDQAQVRVLGQVRHQLVERVGDVQRRQPHLVRLGTLADHLGHRDVEQRGLLALLLGRRGHHLGGLGVHGLERLHLGDREGEDAADRAALVAGDAGPARRRAGDVRRLEPQQRRLVGLEVAQARHGGQLVGVGDAEHRARLAGGEGAQADPVGQVRLQPPQAALLEPLRGEQEVQAQRAAQSADRHEQVDELGLGREHLGELVDHDEQRRHRVEGLAVGAGLLVVAHRGVVAGVAQQLLAPGHLAGEGVLHAVDQRELVGEVGDDGRDVRHVGHAGEGGATLEVDEHQVELLRGVGHHQAEDQGAQELRLARTRRADHQAVGAHALLGGLLDVEVDQPAGVADADRDPEPVAGRAWSPRGRRVVGGDVAEREQVHVVGRGGGDVDGPAGRGRLGARGLQRRDAPGERLGGRDVALVGEGLDRLAAQPQRQHGPLAELVGGVHELQPQPGGVLQLVPPRGQVEQRHPVQAVRRDDVVAGRQGAAVDDEQDVRRRGTLVGTEAGTVAEVGGQQVAQVVERGGDHPHRSDGVGLAGALGVGQPLDPVPVGEVLLGAEHGDQQLVGVLERGGRADHGPGGGAGLLGVAAQLDAVEGPQVDRGRQVGLVAVDREQPVQGGGRGRVDLVDRRALRRHQLQRERLRAQAVAHLEEVLVRRGVLPQPGPVLGERRQRRRLGVVPVQRAALLVGRLTRHLADVREVAEVLRARPGDLLGALLSLTVDLDHDEAQGGEQEHAGRQEAAAAVGPAHGRDQHDRAQAAQHRDGVHQHAAGALALLELRWRLQHDLTARHLRLVEPLPAPQRRAHASPMFGRRLLGQRPSRRR